jgi:hydroxymethylpyrimidine pyrophosphatase-like HAD family hydrolase
MPGIFCQGLLVYDADGEVIYSNPLPDELAAEGIDFAKSRGVSLVAFCKVLPSPAPS